MKYGREVSQLLQGVIAVKPVWFGRKPKVCVVNEGVPGIHEDGRGCRHQALPLLAGQQTADEEHSREHESIDRDEVPRPGHADGMTIARRGDHGREIASVLFGRPELIPRNLQRSESQPFASGRAVIVQVQARMVHQNREAAAHQHEQEKHIEEVGPAYPDGKTVRSAHRALRARRRKARCTACRRPLPESRPGSAEQDERHENRQSGRTNPEAEPPVGGIVNSTMRIVKRDHWIPRNEADTDPAES